MSNQDAMRDHQEQNVYFRYQRFRYTAQDLETNFETWCLTIKDRVRDVFKNDFLSLTQDRVYVICSRRI